MKAMTILLNQMSNRGFTPQVWKFALVCPLLKPGKDAKDLSNYRPISLISNLSKLWEKMIAAKIEFWLEELQLIPNSQFGFAKGLSSTHALSSLGAVISRSLQKKKPILAVAIDIQKAYDSVDPGLLIEKLMNCGLDEHWVRAVYHLLMNRLFSVRIEENISRVFHAVIGLPQGSALAPLLFKFFIHDLPAPGRNMKSFGFADDLLTVAWGQPHWIQLKMQRYLSRLHEYYKNNGLTVNVSKSQAITITGTLNRLTRSTRQQCGQIQVKMDGNIIPKADSLKYLGITINEKYSFVQNTSRAVSKICNTMGCMKRILTCQGLLTPESKVAFYKAAIRPVLAYGFPIWSMISSHQMERIRSAERRFLRWTRRDRGRKELKYINSSRLYAEANVSRIDVWMIALYLKTFEKFRLSENEWIQAMFNDDSVVRAARPEKYPGPEMLFHHNVIHPLVNDQGKMLHYNRRIRDGGEIYVTAQ